MTDRKSRGDMPAFPDREVIAKAEERFAKADKQRAGLKADPKREVARERQRIKRNRKGGPADC
jgi:hypothetical protein